jgi:hypothetical protein
VELSVTAVTAHRFLAKALRRLNPHIKALEEAISAADLNAPPKPILMLTIVDSPPGHCREIASEGRILQYEIGYETSLSLKPRDAATDDPRFLSNFVDGVGDVLDAVSFTEHDRTRLKAIYDQWKSTTSQMQRTRR